MSTGNSFEMPAGASGKEQQMTSTVPFSLPKAQGIEALKNLLEQQGIAVEAQSEIPYGYRFSCMAQERFYLVLYYSKNGICTKLVQQNGPQGLAELLASQCCGNAGAKACASKEVSCFTARPVKEISLTGCRIGTDESGKGDFFGPLVVAGVYVNERSEALLDTLGVKDSKLSSDKRNLELARGIRSMLPKEDIEVLCLLPGSYNRLYERIGNLNTLLAWAHSRVIENLLERHGACCDVIVDQFAGEYVLKRALMERGRGARVLQTPKGERDTAVAAASIIARERFLTEMERLSRSAGPEGFILPKGAGAAADRAAQGICRLSGRDSLSEFAKLHFKNFEKLK